MSILKKATEKGSDKELLEVDKLAELFKDAPLSLEEKLVNPGLFIRRQELSYILANYEIFKLIQNIKGSIFYFGVYHGAGFMTFANLSAALEPFNHTREIIGFDTFFGYPEITEEDVTPGKSFRTLEKGGYKSDSYNFLQSFFKLYDGNRSLSHIPKVKLVKGDVCQTVPDYLKKNQHTIVSLAIFTMNLYKPTKIAFKSVWSRMPKGGICVMHSLNEECYPGATRPVFEALGSNVKINTFPFAPNLAYIVKN